MVFAGGAMRARAAEIAVQGNISASQGAER